MQTFVVKLQSQAPDSFRTKRAADALDIDIVEKLTHELKIEADIESPFKIGLVVGASGSGKTTLVQSIFGPDCFKTFLDLGRPIIDQFPEQMTYDECANILNGIGLSQVTCWIRPAKTLSNGQRARAEAALALASDAEFIIIDEWTSVVDRTVAKAMSYCLSKFTKRSNKKIILCSCHYDVTEWLDPDWIIDCNKQSFIDRRSLRIEERQRIERIKFDIRETTAREWRNFAKYHYLSSKLPGGFNVYFGIFLENGEQIGHQMFSNYRPYSNKKMKMQMHSNRTVIHPDYCGFGLGMRLISLTSKIMHDRGYDVRAKFSSLPVFKAMQKDPNWKLLDVQRRMKNTPSSLQISVTARVHVKTYSFAYRPMNIELK